MEQEKLRNKREEPVSRKDKEKATRKQGVCGQWGVKWEPAWSLPLSLSFSLPLCGI